MADPAARTNNEGAVRVALTFDFDAMSPWLQLSTSSPSFVSRGEFGRVGVERIRAILNSCGIAATWFVPGHSALAFPDVVQDLVGDGHEIAHHGWVHEGLSQLSPDQERRLLERGLAALDEVAGITPSGFRAPGWDTSVSTVDLLLEYGFHYDSSCMGHDFSPYWCRSGDRLSASDPYVFGDPVDLVEIPVAWHLDDAPHFEFVPGLMNFTASAGPAQVFDVWKAEFLYLHDVVKQGCLVLTMHPQTIGRGYRISHLERFIAFVREHKRAAFTTAREIALAWRDRNWRGEV